METELFNTKIHLNGREIPLGIAATASIESSLWRQRSSKQIGDGILAMSGSGAAAIMEHLPLDGATQFLFDGVDGKLIFGEFDGANWVDVNPRDPFGWSIAAEHTNIGPLEIDTGTAAIYVSGAVYDAWLIQVPFPTLEQDGVLYIDCTAEPDRLPDLDIKLTGDQGVQAYAVAGSILLGTEVFTHPETKIKWCYSLLQTQDQESDDEDSDGEAAFEEDALIG